MVAFLHKKSWLRVPDILQIYGSWPLTGIYFQKNVPTWVVIHIFRSFTFPFSILFFRNCLFFSENERQNMVTQYNLGWLHFFSEKENKIALRPQVQPFKVLALYSGKLYIHLLGFLSSKLLFCFYEYIRLKTMGQRKRVTRFSEVTLVWACYET